MGVGDQDRHLGVESNQQIEKIVVTVEHKA
jgi:hypothetical protein